MAVVEIVGWGYSLRNLRYCYVTYSKLAFGEVTIILHQAVVL